MKFSEKRKRKIRKQNQRRINKCCKYMIGYCVDFENDTIVIDQAKIEDIIYLLTINVDHQYEIYKIVKVDEFVKLSGKRVLERQEEFLKKDCWQDESKLTINSDGTIDLKNVVFL